MSPRQHNRSTRGPGGRAGRRPPTRGRGTGVINCGPAATVGLTVISIGLYALVALIAAHLT